MANTLINDKWCPLAAIDYAKTNTLSTCETMLTVIPCEPSAKDLGHSQWWHTLVQSERE